MGFQLQSPWWKLFDLPDHRRLLARKVVLFFRLEADHFVCTNTNKINFGDYFTNSPETVASIHFLLPISSQVVLLASGQATLWVTFTSHFAAWHLSSTQDDVTWSYFIVLCVCVRARASTHASLSVRQVCAIGIYSSLFCVQLVIVCKRFFTVRVPACFRKACLCVGGYSNVWINKPTCRWMCVTCFSIIHMCGEIHLNTYMCLQLCLCFGLSHCILFY